VTLEIILSKNDLAKPPVFIGILLVAISLNAHAQQFPNQVDLKAAYCIDVIQNQVAVMSTPTPNDNANRFLAEYLDKANSNLRRLRLYLVPRLLSLIQSESLDPFSISGLQAASVRGKEDAMRAMHDADVCLTFCQNVKCLNKCRDGDACRTSCQDMKCLSKCVEKSEARTRTQMCNDLSFLPF